MTAGQDAIMKSRSGGRSTAVGRSMITAGWVVGSLATATALGLAALVAAEIVGGTGVPRGWDQLGEAFSVVNAVFSALALMVVGVTLWVQYHELRMQRVELHRQGEATRRSAEASVRKLHVHLINMAIEDEELAAVWPAYERDLTPTERKQFFYANLILSHTNLIGSAVDREPEYQRRLLIDLFQSPIVRHFWEATRVDRDAMRTQGADHDRSFDQLCEDAYLSAYADQADQT